VTSPRKFLARERPKAPRDPAAIGVSAPAPAAPAAIPLDPDREPGSAHAGLHEVLPGPGAHGLAPTEIGALLDTALGVKSGAGPEPEGESPRAGERWRALLGGMGPREVLARLLQGDPLELRRVVAARLAAGAYLFDADRVHLRALAHCARRAVRYRGNPPLAPWLVLQVDQALADLLREDLQAERRGAVLEEPESAVLSDLARPLGLDPATMRRVCLTHNLLPDAERQAFHALVIAGKSLEQVALEQGASGVEIARRARRGLEAVLIAAGAHGRTRPEEGRVEEGRVPEPEVQDSAGLQNPAISEAPPREERRFPPGGRPGRAPVAPTRDGSAAVATPGPPSTSRARHDLRKTSSPRPDTDRSR
jgi:DNA-directed RNA polymerase specialized sigma24 family protein